MRSHRHALPLASVVLAAALALAACGSEARPAPSPTDDAQATGSRTRTVDPQLRARVMKSAPAVLPLKVPSRADAGDTITTSYTATPEASCELRVRYERSGQMVSFPPSVAGEDGRVSWTWTPEPSSAGDVAVAFVVCSGGEQWQTKIPLD